MEPSTSTSVYSETESELTTETFEDVFREAYIKFIKKCGDPCKTPSQVIKTGERRWRRLPKYKKVEYLQKVLQSRKRRQHKLASMKKRPRCCVDRRHTFTGVPRDAKSELVVKFLLDEIHDMFHDSKKYTGD